MGCCVGAERGEVDNRLCPPPKHNGAVESGGYKAENVGYYNTCTNVDNERVASDFCREMLVFCWWCIGGIMEC